MIVDTHVHTFPPLSGPSGRPTLAEHLGFLQRVNYGAINRPRRERDHAIIHENTLWNGRDIGPEGLTKVGFRPGQYGRMVWEFDGEPVYLQWFAPSLRELKSPPEYIIVEMDYAGVDAGILQNTHCYGALNDYFADCAERYPGRFVGTIQILEPLAHTDEQLAELERGARVLGHRGLMYQASGHWLASYRERADDPKFRPFWSMVEALGLIVYWDPGSAIEATPAAYLEQVALMLSILERHPGIRIIIPMAWPISYFGRDGRYELPDLALKAGAHPQIFSELCYPIVRGHEWEYPYRELWPYIQQLCDWFGPESLVCGSDMPNALRFCTYRQSHEYLNHCPFLTAEERSAIQGDTAARLFGLDREPLVGVQSPASTADRS